MFFTVVIIKSFKKSLSQELVYSYQKKAQLNKFYLMFNQAWGNDEQIECFILSANTVDQEEEWDTFTNQFKDKMTSSLDALNTQLLSSNKQVRTKLCDFSKDMKHNIHATDQEAWNKIQELNDLYRESYKNQEIKAKAEIER